MAVRLLATLLALALLAGSAQAWMASPERPHHADLAVRSAERLPPEWREELIAYRGELRKGALDPDGVTDPDAGVHTFYHTYEPSQRRGGAVYQVEKSLHEAVVAMREGRPDAEVAYRLGFLLHFVTDLAVPFHTGDDLYDHALHGPFEEGAYDHQHRDLAQRAPVEVEDVEARMEDVARRSAALADQLVAALEASGGAWSPEVDAIARESEALAVEAGADLLATAFARADPARPEPAFDEPTPLPREPEDVGLTLEEQWRQDPDLLVGLGIILGALALAGGVAVARRRGL